jgi:hypothetical protein
MQRTRSNSSKDEMKSNSLTSSAVTSAMRTFSTTFSNAFKDEKAAAVRTKSNASKDEKAASIVRTTSNASKDEKAASIVRTKRNASKDEKSASIVRTKSNASKDGSSAQNTTVTSDNDFDAMTIRTFGSNDEDSMAGYSLATAEGLAQALVESSLLTPRKQQESSMETTTDGLDSPKSPKKNNPQMKWFEQPSLRPTKSDDFISSDSESNLTLEELSNPLRNSITGVEIEQDLFLDDANTSTEDEDDESLKGSSSVMSGIMSLSETSGSDAEGMYVSQTSQPHGALGYFSRDEEEDAYLEIYDVLPQITPEKSCSLADNLSDAPSDERNDSVQQDLSGFGSSEAIQKGLDHYTTPERYADNNSSSSPNFQPHIIPSGSWDEEDPEVIEHFLRERRRIKRAARKNRAERKQPPVTMEV